MVCRNDGGQRAGGHFKELFGIFTGTADRRKEHEKGKGAGWFEPSSPSMRHITISCNFFFCLTVHKGTTCPHQRLNMILSSFSVCCYSMIVETVRLMMNMFDTGAIRLGSLFEYTFQRKPTQVLLTKVEWLRLWSRNIIDNSGQINFAEFSGLWKYIEEWRACFRAFDQDQSGSIDFNELRTAMRSFRYNLSDNFLRLLIKKYDRNGKL